MGLSAQLSTELPSIAVVVLTTGAVFAVAARICRPTLDPDSSSDVSLRHTTFCSGGVYLTSQSALLWLAPVTTPNVRAPTTFCRFLFTLPPPRERSSELLWSSMSDVYTGLLSSFPDVFCRSLLR